MEPTEGEKAVVSADTGEVEVDEEKEQLISTWDKIVAQREKIIQLTKDEVVAKKEHAAAKAALDKGWEALGNLIDEEKRGYEPNLFNQKPEKEDESWREVFIGSIGLPDAVAEKLIQADLNSIGKLSDWSNSGKMLTDIPGIGTQTAEKINDCLTAFWEKRHKAEEASRAAADAVIKAAEAQKARRATPDQAAELKKKADEATITAGLAAMGMGPNPTVATGNDTPKVDTTEQTKGW